MSTQAPEEAVRVRAENIGGIDATEVTLSPGVTVLAGRNASNRTSFLQAIMTALGSNHTTLKGDAEQGEVELTVDGDTYTRTLQRDNGHLSFSGDPLLEDTQEADLFAFLLERNDVRRAVARGDDLRDLIMEPVDTDAIQAEITQRERERQSLEEELDRLDDLEADLPDLEAERHRLETRLEEKQAQLESKREELAALDADVEETREQKAEREDALEELRSTRTQLENARNRLETERESLAALEDEREEVQAELDALPEAPAGDTAELDTEIDRLRDHKASIESTISQLQNIIQFNQDMLEGDRPDLSAAIEPESTDAAAEELTDQLVDATVRCWTCGSEVERDQIGTTVEHLRDLRREKAQERNELTSRIDELTAERDEYRQQQREREQLERRLQRINDEIADREARIDEYEATIDDLEADLEALEADVETLEAAEDSEILEVQKAITQLEVECDSLRDDIDEIDAEIDSIEDELATREQLEDQRTELADELTDLRTRIETLEEEAVTAFNDHMATILDILEYENIERIWLERVERETREGRRKVTKTAFDLHVVRSTDGGTVYEDTVEHLSESEREVTGLVLALAGYLVHDLHETVPFMLLDSLEALDAPRIAELVEYFAGHSTYLVVALLPEDAAALDEEYATVTDI